VKLHDQWEVIVEKYWDRIRSNRLSRRRLMAAAAASGVSAAFLAACGSDDNGGSSSGATEQASPAAGTPVQGGRFGWFFFSSSNYNPVSNWKEGQNLSGQHVYDRPLSTRVDKRNYVLEALDSLEIASPTRVVMKLKPNLVYQDKAPVNGRAVKASDIVATQNYVKSLSNAYDRAWQVDYIQSIEAPDQQTVVLNLTKPDAYLTSANHLSSSTSWCIIPEEMLSALDTTEPVGSGPYVQAEAQVDVRYVTAAIRPTGAPPRSCPTSTSG
jgi:ABC-type transport system substrate-binding protein